ncbi:MAG TPA: hypothetical protein VFM21_04480, partial [Terriglobia bacterium]|nr:hypothetical protein [Terriglobia bacterium]
SVKSGGSKRTRPRGLALAPGIVIALAAKPAAVTIPKTRPEFALPNPTTQYDAKGVSSVSKGLSKDVKGGVTIWPAREPRALTLVQRVGYTQFESQSGDCPARGRIRSRLEL